VRILAWLRHNEPFRKTLWWMLRPVHWIRSLSRRALALLAWLAGTRALPGRAVDGALIAWDNRRRRRKPPVEMAIFDDCFPYLLSAFRIAEFNAYFAEFPSAEVHTTCAVRKMEGLSYKTVAEEYAANFPQYADRAVLYHPQRIVRARLAYVVFVHNVVCFLQTIERNRLPFVYTLYPGGGFQPNTEAGDERLQVMRSPWFRKVIITQSITRDYLLERKFCRPDQVEFIFGGVLPTDQLRQNLQPRLKYRKTKPTFDVCFVANKYMPRGLDKGYDVFIEVTKSLARTAAGIRFHVVGPFDGSDIDVHEMADRIQFHGLQRTEFFPQFYAGMDIILSPNVPFTLGPGYFDGFPTGCCVEAAMCGVAVLCSDELRLNVAFKDGEEIVIVPRNVEAICDRVLAYYRDEAALEELSRNGQAAFRRVFDVASQMAPRIRLLRKVMAETPGR
jgi:glycosyltransferase involved in cell wall biosynthesis